MVKYYRDLIQTYCNHGKIIPISHTKIIILKLWYPYQLSRVQGRKLCQLSHVEVKQQAVQK